MKKLFGRDKSKTKVVPSDIGTGAPDVRILILSRFASLIMHRATFPMHMRANSMKDRGRALHSPQRSTGTSSKVMRNPTLSAPPSPRPTLFPWLRQRPRRMRQHRALSHPSLLHLLPTSWLIKTENATRKSYARKYQIAMGMAAPWPPSEYCAR